MKLQVLDLEVPISTTRRGIVVGIPFGTLACTQTGLATLTAGRDPSYGLIGGVCSKNKPSNVDADGVRVPDRERSLESSASGRSSRRAVPQPISHVASRGNCYRGLADSGFVPNLSRLRLRTPNSPGSGRCDMGAQYRPESSETQSQLRRTDLQISTDPSNYDTNL